MLFRTLRASRAIKRGDFARALAIAPESMSVLSQLGMHISVLDRRGQARSAEDDFAVTRALADLGDIGQVRARAGALAKTSAPRRLAIAVAVARWDPGFALELAPVAKSLPRAAIHLALGDITAAARELESIGETVDPEVSAVRASLAARTGDHRGARRHLATATGRDGVSVIDTFDHAPINLFAFRPMFSGRFDGEIVSVIMAARNSRETIQAAVASVLQQSWRPLELIVVDDASTDDSVDVALDAIGSERRARVVKLDRQVGPYAARNFGIGLSQGAVVAFQDADDASHPARLQESMEALDADPRNIGSVSRLVRFEETGVPMSPRIFPLIRANPSSLVVRRRVFQEIGGFEEVPFGADNELFSRICARYGPSSIIRSPALRTLASWRRGGLTRSTNSGILDKGANLRRQEYFESWMRRLYFRDAQSELSVPRR